MNVQLGTSALIVGLLLVFDTAALAKDPAHEDLAESATKDIAGVQHVMDAFHDAVVGHNGERLSALFLPNGSTWLNVLSNEAYARLKKTSPQLTKVRVSSYKDFAAFVSTTKNALEPKHSHVQIHTDGTIATVYFDFVFFIDGKEENRGSETWQLVNGTEGWRIAAISYSSNPHAP
jgi:hypothetical protein